MTTITAVGLITIIVVQMILGHLRNESNTERLRARDNQTRSDTINAIRQGIQVGLNIVAVAHDREEDSHNDEH